MPFPPPGDFPDPGIKPRPPTFQADSLPSEPQGKLKRQQFRETENKSELPKLGESISSEAAAGVELLGRADLDEKQRKGNVESGTLA